MFLKSFLTSLLNLLCPPMCPICHERVDEPHCLCGDCYKKFRFISKPCCQICGRPFEYAALGQVICGGCLKNKPYYRMARSVVIYDDFSKQLVLAFKHGDRPELAILLGKFLAQIENDFFQGIDLVIPVPLHWRKRWKRMYNQAALLSREISRTRHIPFLPNILIRKKQTESQGHKTKSQRERNIKNAFRIPRPSFIRGKSILLVDDVMTTGATVNECARVLCRAGATEVRVITVYRVLR